jgi:DNA polymerase V
MQWHCPKEAFPARLVLSNNDGCAVARSNEVKAMGIKMGAPLHQIRLLVQQHNIQVFSSITSVIK